MLFSVFFFSFRSFHTALLVALKLTPNIGICGAFYVFTALVISFFQQANTYGSLQAYRKKNKKMYEDIWKKCKSSTSCTVPPASP